MRKRRVRIHFKPATGMDASLEGVLMRRFPGRYVIELPTLIEAEDRSVSIEGRIVVLRENILFWEQL